MAVIAGFIDRDGNGNPFMGLYVEDGTLSVKLYIAHKENAIKAAAELSKQLEQMALDIQKEKKEVRIIPVSGVIENGAIRGKP